MPNLTLGGATATCLIEICAVRCELPELPLVKFVELDKAVVAASADTAIRTARTLIRPLSGYPEAIFPRTWLFSRSLWTSDIPLNFGTHAIFCRICIPYGVPCRDSLGRVE